MHNDKEYDLERDEPFNGLSIKEDSITMAYIFGLILIEKDMIRFEEQCDNFFKTDVTIKEAIKIIKEFLKWLEDVQKKKNTRLDTSPDMVG
jgi:transcriptional regulatory protein LevR